MEKFLESTGKRWPKRLIIEIIITMVLSGLNLPLEMEGDLVIPFFTTEKDRWGGDPLVSSYQGFSKV
jgi:hypothetical protein